ncbi:hypothetical protein MK489_09960 [Myxococcota bacterium]|nr:hypothetical protein [Myxococcota bacterium]
MRCSSAARRRVLLGLIAACALCVPTASWATPETLRRAISNIVCAPGDVLLSPVVATYTVVDNMRSINDSTGVRVAYAFPAVVWNTGIVVGIGVIREITGLLELFPGVGLFFSESDIDPLLAPVENSEALWEYENDAIYLRVGMLYTA